MSEIVPVPTPRPQYDDPMLAPLQSIPVPSGRPIEDPEPDFGHEQDEDFDLKVGQDRSLTAGEITMARKYFKDSVEYGSVRLKRGKFIPLQHKKTAMTPNGNMYFPGSIYKNDFSETGLFDRAFFIHEMVHVWQTQNKITGNIKMLGIRSVFDYNKPGPYTKRPGKFLYDYKYEPFGEDGSLDLTDYGFEQQASIIEDYYYIINGASPMNSAGNYTKDYYDDPNYGLLRNFLRDPDYSEDRRQNIKRRP